MGFSGYSSAAPEDPCLRGALAFADALMEDAYVSTHQVTQLSSERWLLANRFVPLALL